jgi:hypothetical protein
VYPRGQRPIGIHNSELFFKAVIFAGGAIQPGALLLEFILEQVDLIFLHPQFALEQLLIDVAFTTGLQDRCSHRDGQDRPS